MLKRDWAVVCYLVNCLQYESRESEFSLRESLVDVLVHNKVEFVQLFMERMVVSEFLTRECLVSLYEQVPVTSLCFVDCVQINYICCTFKLAYRTKLSRGDIGCFRIGAALDRERLRTQGSLDTGD